MNKHPRHNTTGQKQHTNPKARLKLWESKEVRGHIWCYGKQREPGRRVHRQTVASATVLHGIWDSEDEDRLNTEIEQPAESGLEQLSEAPVPCLERDQRQAVAKYLMSLFRRGWQELAAQPQRLRPEITRLEALIEAVGFAPAAMEALGANIAELAEHPPGRPFPIETVSDVLAAMRWTVLECRHGSFITGDSPVQITPDAIANRDCEVTMPLSPSRALVCDWGIPQPWTAVRAAAAAEASEVNRRTAHAAENCIYFACSPEEDDVLEVLNGRARTRIHEENGTRGVPRRHRVTMELGRRQIVEGRGEENRELVEQLRELASSSGLVTGSEDPSS